MRYFFFLSIVCIGGCTTSSKPSAGEKAHTIVQQTVRAMGGIDAFAEKRFLRFDFVVVRGDSEVSHHQHLWDRQENRYRVEGRLRDGTPYVVMFSDLNARKGAALKGGVQVDSVEAGKLLNYGYGRFINDTYWLLMPWKMSDPGVHLTYSGTDSSNVFDIIHLQFDSVGLTPGDQYWAYIDKDTRLVRRWKFELQDGETGDYDWSEWRDIDGIKFSLEKTSRTKPAAIKNPSVRFPKDVDDNVFSDATVPLP